MLSVMHVFSFGTMNLLLRRIGQFALWLGKGGVANQERARKMGETAISTAQQTVARAKVRRLAPSILRHSQNEFYDDKANPRRTAK